VYKLSMRTIGLWLIGIVLFSLAVHRGIIVAQPSIWERASSYITYPFMRISSAIIIPIKQWFYERAVMRELLERHNALRDEYADLRGAYIRCRAAEGIEEDTNDLISYNETSEDKGHIAQIMMRHFSDQGHYYLVDAGSVHGIEPDMFALYKNCLVGRVTHVYPYYCKVTLITDQMCKVAAYCFETKASGIHEGVNAVNVTTLRHVSHLSMVQENDLILSSGEGLIFPRGYALGTVASCTHDGLLYSIRVQPLLDFNTLQYCVLSRRGDLIKADVAEETNI
jgi:rod shape-determining protein MreC